MTDDPHPLDYNATLNRMETGIAPVDMILSLASIAISLKRIADHMPDHPLTGPELVYQLQSIANSINNHNQRAIYVSKA